MIVDDALSGVVGGDVDKTVRVVVLFRAVLAAGADKIVGQRRGLAFGDIFGEKAFRGADAGQIPIKVGLPVAFEFGFDQGAVLIAG